MPRPRMLSLFLALSVVCCLVSRDVAAQGNEHPNENSIKNRGDIKQLPAPLKERIVELAGRPHSFLPLTVFAEAPTPSQLFGYYLLDTTGFQPNVFTAVSYTHLTLPTSDLV